MDTPPDDQLQAMFAREPSGLEFVGPFEHHEVVLHGWQVPFVSAGALPDGGVHLILDGRFGVDIAKGDAERIIPFLADCIAVALGYTCHPREGWDAPLKREPFVPLRRIRSVEESPSP